MSHVFRAWCTLFLVGSPNLSILAQTTAPANSISPGSAKAPSAEQRALGLLDQLFAATKDIKDDDLRIRLQAQLASTLWDYDQPRARQQFLSAFQAIALAKLPEGEDRFQPPPYVGAGARFPLRNEILMMVSQRDPALTKEMIDSIVDDGPDPTPRLSRSPSRTGDDRANHYMLLAAALLSTDPARAIEAAQTGLAESAGNANVFSSFVRFLQSLGQKDRAAADRLFNYALSVVQRDLLHFAGSIRWLSIYVFPDYGGVIRLYFGPGPDPRPSQEASPPVVESFLDFVFNAVVQQSSSQSPPSAPPWAASDYAAVKLLLPYFDKRMPEKAATLRSKLDETVRSYPPDDWWEGQLQS